VSYFHVASAEPIAGFTARAAVPTSVSSLGQPPSPKLSAGQFGLAMSHVQMPAESIKLLLLSPTFKQMAQVLDNAYLDHRRWNALREKNDALKLNKDFRVVGGGGFNGRRILYVHTSAAGSMFIPGQSVESEIGWDEIRFKFALTDSDIIPWIEAIAHETAHAFARVTATGPGPKTPEQRVQAGVLDECTTRRRELKVIAEIRATAAGRKAFTGFRPRLVRTCDCERDWFPAAQKRTYLEHFVLGMDWESAARGLSTAERNKAVTHAASIPIVWSAKDKPPSMAVAILRGTATIDSFVPKFPVLKSPACRAAFVLRLVDASWRQLIAKVVEDSPTWKGGAHQLRLERHAKVFFNIPVTYTKCP